MTTMQTAIAADEIHARAEAHMSEHQGVSYKEALGAVLAADRQLAQAYAQPAVKPADPRSQPVVNVAAADAREILDWITRGLAADMAGWLPGALGDLALEADSFKKLGMPIEEAARRAMDSNPALVAMAKLVLADIRRNAPTDEAAQTPGDIAHNRAQALTDKHPHLSYSAALHQVLDEDETLKINYARS